MNTEKEPAMQMLDERSACCAHSIVMRSSVHVGDGLLKDAWHCCDCGLRFSIDQSLPMFVPEKSHLHKKLDSCADEIVALRARVAELEQAVRYIFKETQNTGYGNPIVMERMIDRIEECAINAIDAARGDV